MERFYADARDADVIIYNATVDEGVASVAELVQRNALLADFRAVREGNVWTCDSTMYQQMTSMADIIFDLRAAISGSGAHHLRLEAGLAWAARCTGQAGGREGRGVASACLRPRRPSRPGGALRRQPLPGQRGDHARRGAAHTRGRPRRQLHRSSGHLADSPAPSHRGGAAGRGPSRSRASCCRPSLPTPSPTPLCWASHRAPSSWWPW